MLWKDVFMKLWCTHASICVCNNVYTCVLQIMKNHEFKESKDGHMGLFGERKGKGKIIKL